MQQQRGTLRGKGGVSLVYAQWATDAPLTGVVVLVHGIGEHMGRYGHVVDALVEGGYAVFAIDHRGHGKSDGERANVERFDDFVEDLHLLVTKAKDCYPHAPLFMLGHSMGGLIAVHYALTHEALLDGLIVSGPALRIGDNVSPLLKAAGRIIARLAPSLPVVAGTPDCLSRDPEVQRRFDADPLTYKGKTKARIAYELMRASQDACERCPQLSLPVLIMHGEADMLTNPEGSKLFYERAASADKTLKLWPEHRHEIFNELEKEEVIAFMLDWLDERSTTHEAAES